MSLISVDTLNAAKLRYAGTDLRAAKKHGYILIGQTRRGTLNLTYSARADSAGVYTLTDTSGHLIAHGKAAVVRPVLADLYTVEFR